MEEDSRLAGDLRTPRPSWRRGPEDLSDTEESILTPLSCSSPPAANHSLRDRSALNSCSNRSPAGHISKASGLCHRELNEASPADPVDWENLPFSEGLSMFLCDENTLCTVSKTKSHLNLQYRVETPKNNSSLIQENNFCQALLPRRPTQMADRRSQTWLNITNRGHVAGDHRDLPDHVRRTTMRSVSRRQSKNPTFEKPHLEDSKTRLESFDGGNEEAFGRDSYNFSADLFSSFLASNVSTDAHAETVTAFFPAETAAGRRSPESRTMRESLVPADGQDLDFVPPSQSTPIVKAAGARDSSYRPSGFASSFTPKRNSGKVGGAKDQLVIQQPIGTQVGSPIVGSTERIHHKRDSGSSDLTVCDNEDSRDAVLPPTPAAKTKQSVKVHMRRRIDNNNFSLGPKEGEQGGPGKRVRLNQTPAALHTQTGSCENGGIFAGGLERWNNDSYACNLSRDLFSDSV